VVLAPGGSDDNGDVGPAAGARAGPGAAERRYPYPAAAVRNFVGACAETSGQRRACVCTIERLQRTLPYRDFAAADAAVRAGRPASPRTQRVFDVAAGECRN
jgi:hypothetical protein